MTKTVRRFVIMGLIIGLQIARALSASAQGLQPRRTLGSRLARPAQTASCNADSVEEREARSARAAQRSQFAAGPLTAEFERERDTLFMDIVREAEICQTNLAEYATYPYWPDAMGVVSNFCEKENCVVVDVGHHFGSWRQGSWWQGRGKKAYVVRCNLGTRKKFVPLNFVPLNRRIWGEVLGSDGFCTISRSGFYTNVACRAVGSVCCYDSDGRFVEMCDSLDKIPGMKQCFDDELKVNYAEQDRWMKAHGFSDEGSGQGAELKLDAARTNMIARLEALRTVLSKFPQWKAGNKWHQVCDVCAEFRDPITGGGFNRSSSSGINTNDAVFVKMSERFENLGHSQDQLIAEFVRVLTGLEFGSSTDTNGVLDLKFNLGSYETCTFGRGSGTGGVNRVTLIAEFDPDSEQNTIHEKLDMSLSTLLSAIGMDRDALAYNESANGGRPLQGGLRRPGGNQDWKSVWSFSQRFLISRSRQQSGEYVVTISDQKKAAVQTANDNARRPAGLLGGSLRARRLQRQQEAEAAAAKQQEEQSAKDAEQRQQLLLIQEELKRVREAKAVAAREEGGKVGASCSTSNQLASLVRKEDFKAKLTGVAIIEGGRMCGFESRALKAEFQSPEHSIEVPFGKAACFRVEYDFPDGYQARVWTRDRWQKGQDGSSYYFGSNPSPLYKGKGIAYGFLDMLERGKTCTLKQLAIGTNAEPKLEELPRGWDIVVTPVDIKFLGPETAQKAPSKEGEKDILNNQSQGTNAVSNKLQSCDFLLNKDFKKNAKVYLCLFSASWCGPCRAEMPRIAKTYAETLKDDPDIELVHFSRDQNDEKALAWAKEHDVKFPVVKPKGGNPLDLHSRGIPHLFIVKADGTLVEEGHPMRIFNEEKFREIKSGNMKPRTADADLKSGERTEQVDGYTWTYRVENGGAMIVAAGGKRRCTISPSPKGNLTIPSRLGGMNVTKIGSEAFCECSGITSVTFPASVKEICWRAFSECGSLASVSIPSGVTKIYPAAFSECKSLTAITVSDENAQYASRDGILFDKGVKTLVCYPGGIPGEYAVPSGVTRIGGNAFSGCSGLTSVTVSDDVAQIGEWAFSGCRGLNSVKIGRGVTRMAQGPFYRCSGLTSVSVDAGNERYASRDGVLFDKGMKTLICCPSGISGEYIIPSSVTSIGIYAFDSCRKLTSVTIPDGVTSIAPSVFCYSDQLAVVSVPGSVKGIGDWAFSGCRGLNTVKISDGVTSIGTGTFCGCFKLTSMMIPSSVKSIKKYAFSGCRELTSVTMHGERPEVEADAFKSCDKLKAIHVPANAKSWAGMTEWQGIPLVFDAETK